jgi:hypothetical protein
MSIANFAELKTAIGSWLGHELFADRYNDFITLFEAAACRRLKVRPMEMLTTLAPSFGATALPADYLGWRRATVTSTPRIELTYVHPSYLQALYPAALSDLPRHFTIEASALKTRSSDSTPIELLYYAKTPAIANALNWLFTNHPDAYLFGSLAEAEAFGVNDERLPMWKSRRDEVLAEIASSEFRERGAMEIRAAGATP